MRRVGEHHRRIALSQGGSDLIAVRGDDHLIGHADRGDALPHADYQRYSAYEAKRLSRESGGSEPGGNDDERLHAEPGNACEAAICTPLKLHPSPSIAKQSTGISSSG